MKFLLCLACVSLSIAAALAQPAAYSPPRTPDGHVDFQGIWTTRWITPLERQPETPALAIARTDAAALTQLLINRVQSGDPLQALDDIDPVQLLDVGGELRSSLIVDPANGLLPYTPEGKKQRAAFVPNRLRGADDPEQRGNNERCLGISSSYAPYLAAPVANIRQIVQTNDHFLIYSEHYIITRIIPFGAEPPTMGDRHGKAQARWEGDTLVVDSTGFRPDDTIRFVPMSVMVISPATHITERFTRISDEEILYRFTVEDQLLYTRAWTGETVMKRSTDRMFEYACHEGNYGLANILSGGRVKGAGPFPAP